MFPNKNDSIFKSIVSLLIHKSVHAVNQKGKIIYSSEATNSSSHILAVYKVNHKLSPHSTPPRLFSFGYCALQLRDHPPLFNSTNITSNTWLLNSLFDKDLTTRACTNKTHGKCKRYLKENPIFCQSQHMGKVYLLF